MSWSDDTRCLYCEGRLPLYRKITHGQFCSSAHRKSYWQEHERLAVERLHQTHSSLRSYRSLTHQEAQQEGVQEAVPYPERELVGVANTGVSSKAYAEAYSEPEMELELYPIPTLGGNLYPAPDLDEPPLPASDLLSLLAPNLVALGENSAQLVATDPFEYEITPRPLSPSSVASAPETSSFPEGPRAAVWSYLPHPSPHASATGAAHGKSGAQENCEGELRHPGSRTPRVAIGAAGRVGFEPRAASETRPTASAMGSRLKVLEMEPAPVTSVALDVPLQSDVMLQLLDQQVERPDQMHALAKFAAHSPVNAPAQKVEPAALTSAIVSDIPLNAARDYRLSQTEMLRLSAGAPAQGRRLSRTTFSEMPAALPQVGCSAATMPSVKASAYNVGTAGLQSLHSNLSHPLRGSTALQTTGAIAIDLSAGVSSDITFPDLAPGARTVVAPRLTRILPLTFTTKRRAGGETSQPVPVARLVPQALETHPVFPNSGLEPVDHKSPVETIRTPQSLLGSLMRGEGLRKLEPAWAHATGFWHHAPRDLKLLLFAIPALLALVFHPGWPRVAFAAQSPSGLTGGFKRVLNQEWTNVRQTLENRAAVALDEDFRSGLDNWASPGGSTTEWSFDSTGFVRPGPLAIYRPSVGLADYQVQFLGLIDKKALSWVVRAADFENFYVVKLEMVKSGPIPVIGLTRYAVINGKARDRHDVTIPLSARPDTLYRVLMNVRGSEFAVEVQGQIADHWTETRLPRGGIGFFTASGEASRLRWVQITHQYDMLGRLCAYLAPYDTTNGSWQP